jgi:hypothetical protein
VTEPGNAQARFWTGCVDAWISVKRARRVPRRPCRSSEKETRSQFEHERRPADLRWYGVNIPATIPLGWKKSHRYSMVDRILKIPESTMLRKPTRSLIRPPKVFAACSTFACFRL